MLRYSKILVTILFLFSLNILHAQSVLLSSSGFPLKQVDSPLFGTDIIIHDQPDHDQRNIAICSAFNGWLYALYSYFDNSINLDNVAILRSKDGGISWSVLIDTPLYIDNVIISKLNILACGQDTNQLKVFAGFMRVNTITNLQVFSINRCDKDGIPEDEIFRAVTTGLIRDFAMASDDLFPASNSTPFSLGVIYSEHTVVGDSITFASSSNGGMSFDSKHKIGSSQHYLHKVALTYGRSPSFSGGRYFAAWEEQNNENSILGHIYTAHSEPHFNSPFTKAVCLDSIDPSAINHARNPVIACQNNEADNDSSNLTEVVLFEKYMSSTQKYNIAGLYNKKATVSDNFQAFTIDASANNKLQPDICFNSFDSTFIVTYFDSTAQKLPYCMQDFNMIYPNTWNVLSTGYNDSNYLISPQPQVIMDFEKKTGANAWIGLRNGGNGASMFDSPFTYYTGYSEKSTTNEIRLINVYPNPCSNEIKISFENMKTGKVTINVLSIIGQPLGTVTYQLYHIGKNLIRYDVSNLPSGTYLYNFKSDEGIKSGKFSILK